MSKYKASVTGKKAGIEFGTISAFGILATITATKIHPFLVANGVTIDTNMLSVGLTATYQSGWKALLNWWKNKGKK